MPLIPKPLPPTPSGRPYSKATTAYQTRTFSASTYMPTPPSYSTAPMSPVNTVATVLPFRPTINARSNVSAQRPGAPSSVGGPSGAPPQSSYSPSYAEGATSLPSTALGPPLPAAFSTPRIVPWIDNRTLAYVCAAGGAYLVWHLYFRKKA